MSLRTMLYTKRLWLEGEDEFLVLQKNEDGSTFLSSVRIDLYTWIHLHRLTRALHLLRYSMKLDTNCKLGTPVRCVCKCVEYSIDQEGTVHSINVPVAPTGMVIFLRPKTVMGPPSIER